MKRTIGILLGALLVAIVIQGWRVVSSSGMLLTLEPRALACSTITGMTGVEDITVDRSGFAYLSADDRRATLAGTPVAGAIYGMDLTAAEPQPLLLWQGSESGFHPHGISLYAQEEGASRLMAINHTLDGRHLVEIFDVTARGQLRHLESLTVAELVSPNDLVAVGERAFYVTNDHGNPPGWGQTAEDYLGLPLSHVVYFDGAVARVAATGFRYANGITVSRDGKLLAVAETTGRRLRLFGRDLETGALTEQSAVTLDTGADNLEWSPEGALLVTAHPRLFDFMAHAADPAVHSPSQVLSVALGESPGVTELYANDGSEISGSSVAAVHGGRMLIGSVFEEKILLCDL